MINRSEASSEGRDLIMIRVVKFSLMQSILSKVDERLREEKMSCKRLIMGCRVLNELRVHFES